MIFSLQSCSKVYLFVAEDSNTLDIGAFDTDAFGQLVDELEYKHRFNETLLMPSLLSNLRLSPVF
jgi:hypothetical protein